MLRVPDDLAGHAGGDVGEFGVDTAYPVGVGEDGRGDGCGVQQVPAAQVGRRVGGVDAVPAPLADPAAALVLVLGDLVDAGRVGARVRPRRCAPCGRRCGGR